MTSSASCAYTYNSDGRKTAETLADSSCYSYGYDSAGQLTSESLNSGGSGTIGALHGYSYTYTYDAAGNRASKYNGTSTDTYSYDSANKLTSAGGKSYTYDYSGNCVSVANSSTGDTVTLAYDGEDRMISASDSASTFSDTYSYNGLDQRVGKVDNTGTFAYTRDGDEVDDAVLADGAAIYNHGAGSGLISENRSGTSKYYHSDALGSTGALTNSSASVTDTRVTDAFGMAVTGSGSTPTPFGFVGQGGYQSDADTGLVLCGHRYYDSSTGRFLSRDPVQAGENWYAYCGNDPVDDDDSSGLVPGKKSAHTKKAHHPKKKKNTKQGPKTPSKGSIGGSGYVNPSSKFSHFSAFVYAKGDFLIRNPDNGVVIVEGSNGGGGISYGSGSSGGGGGGEGTVDVSLDTQAIGQAIVDKATSLITPDPNLGGFKFTN